MKVKYIPVILRHLIGPLAWGIAVGTLIGVIVSINQQNKLAEHQIELSHQINDKAETQISYIRCIAKFFSQDQTMGEVKIASLDKCDIIVKEGDLTQEEQDFLMDLTKGQDPAKE